ncbi:holo-ACP synthase [Salinifilum ghardaiensis]
MIIGVGTDLVGVRRFAESLRRTPELVDRLFTAEERVTWEGRARSVRSLASRFAAKEAAAKALGVPGGTEFTDCAVHSASDGRPVLHVTGGLAAAAAHRSVNRWHVSLTHDAELASAVVIAEHVTEGTAERGSGYAGRPP